MIAHGRGHEVGVMTNNCPLKGMVGTLCKSCTQVAKLMEWISRDGSSLNLYILELWAL